MAQFDGATATQRRGARSPPARMIGLLLRTHGCLPAYLSTHICGPRAHCLQAGWRLTKGPARRCSATATVPCTDRRALQAAAADRHTARHSSRGRREALLQAAGAAAARRAASPRRSSSGTACQPRSPRPAQQPHAAAASAAGRIYAAHAPRSWAPQRGPQAGRTAPGAHGWMPECSCASMHSLAHWRALAQARAHSYARSHTSRSPPARAVWLRAIYI